MNNLSYEALDMSELENFMGGADGKISGCVITNGKCGPEGGCGVCNGRCGNSTSSEDLQDDFFVGP